MAECPVCGEPASESNINIHLDRGCPRFRKAPNWSFLNDPKRRKGPAKTDGALAGNIKNEEPELIENKRIVEEAERIGEPSTKDSGGGPPSPPHSQDKPGLPSGVKSGLVGQSHTSSSQSSQSQLGQSQSTNQMQFGQSKSSPPAKALNRPVAQPTPAKSVVPPTASPAASKPALPSQLAPLAEAMRPKSLTDYVGQTHLVGPNGILTELLSQPDTPLPSMVLWGPSGVGKTTLARVLASQTGARFVELSAPSAGANDVKRVVAEARREWQLLRRRTILFLDEIHRFNRAQQDSLLSGVERGDVALVGATTENPSFKLGGALLSRVRVFVMEPLGKAELRTIVERAVAGATSDETEAKNGKVKDVKDELLDDSVNGGETKESDVKESDGKENGTSASDISSALVDAIIESASSTGDARQALNMLETARKLPSGADPRLLLRHALVHDQRGAQHYDLISAFHKSVRGSDADAALYYLMRMLEGGEDPQYVSRRLMRIASEDIGLADDSCLPFAAAVHTAVQQVGMPECDAMLAHAAVKFARAPKNVEIYKAMKAVRNDLRERPAVSGAPVPLHLRNAPTRLMAENGYGHNYKYNPDYIGPVKQTYLPDNVEGKWLGFEPFKRDGEQ